METYKIISYTALFLGASFLIASCVKDDIYNTPHPTTGAIKITTDWSIHSSESVLPTDYILRIGDAADQKVTDVTNVYHSLFTPGQYELLAYNSPSGMTINGNVATLNTAVDGNTVEALPGYLFSAVQTLDVQKDDTLRTTVKMQQRVRQLTLVVKLKVDEENRLSSLGATLSGLNSSIDVRTGKIAATEGKSVKFDFQKIEPTPEDIAAEGEIAFAATIRLLGVIPSEKQILRIRITLTDQYTDYMETELTSSLASFNSEIKPLRLDAMLELPVQGNFSGNITDWEPGLTEGQGDVTAD